MKEPDEEILKVDVLGRVRIRAERRESVLDEFERSGLPGTRFAKRHGINYQTFASWVQKRKREQGEFPGKRTEAKKALPAFALVEALPAAEPKRNSATGLEVVLPCGATLKIGDEKQVALAAALLRTLGIDR